MAPQISEQDIALLSRYLDGEMQPRAARELEGRLDEEPELRLGLVKLQELNQRLRDVLGEDAGVAPELEAMLQQHVEVSVGVSESIARERSIDATVSVVPDSNVLSFPAPSRSRNTMRWPAAIAASVVLAVAVGVSLDGGNNASISLPGNDSLVSDALDKQVSGDGWARLADGRELQPVLTFPHRDGSWCREYLLRGGSADWRAVACREGERWVTQAAGLESYIDSGNAYRPAGADDAAPVAVFISQHAADIALDRAAEGKLITQWGR
ncbi:MAG: hypothetical protein AAGI72_01845 [Pseudomonadota bacterium]